MRLFRIVAVSIAAFVATSCSISYLAQEEKQAKEALVQSYIDNHEIYIEVDTIIPARGGTKHTTDGYFIKIKDGVANSYLPFFGSSYSAPYGSTYSPQIEYKDCPVQVYEEVNAKGMHTWIFEGKSGETLVTTKIDFFTSGLATITCSSRDRSVMTYHGTVMEDTRKISK